MSTPIWAVLPFATLLILIALGPLRFPHFWEKHYPKLSIGLGAVTAFWLMGHEALAGHFGHSLEKIGHSLLEYFNFIALIGSLYVVSGGIHVHFEGRATASANTWMLALGGALANLVGTTGASMLLIRPFLRFNRGRLKPYHVVFFIFIVSNVGGALTPIGDPPLFLGYLKGVPFFWTLENCMTLWLVCMGGLLGMYYLIDRLNHPGERQTTGRAGMELQGLQQFPFLGVILGLVLLQKAGFLSPFSASGVAIADGLMMVGVACLAYRSADKEILAENGFNMHPIKEVAFLFIGIFLTMIPALDYLGEHAKELGLNEGWKFYLATGSLSAVLDNAPTYMTFLSVALGLQGLSFDDAMAVPKLLGSREGPLLVASVSLGAVFWGAMTYIGNGPNFMVKNIAQQMGAEVPDFVTYILKYSLPILLPILLLVALLLAAGIGV